MPDTDTDTGTGTGTDTGIGWAASRINLRAPVGPRPASLEMIQKRRFRPLRARRNLCDAPEQR